MWWYPLLSHIYTEPSLLLTCIIFVFSRLKTGLTPASLRCTCGWVDRSPSRPWRRRPATRPRTRTKRSAGTPRRGRPSTYRATAWSSSTSALRPPPKRWSRACWRSSWCWTTRASSPCTGRRTATDRVREAACSVSLEAGFHRRVSDRLSRCADLFQKLPLSERPLLLRLIAGPDAEQLTFVLKENETGEVEVRKHPIFISFRTWLKNNK